MKVYLADKNLVRYFQVSWRFKPLFEPRNKWFDNMTVKTNEFDTNELVASKI